MFSFESTPRFPLNSLTRVVATVIFITSTLILPAAVKDSKAEADYNTAAGLYEIELWKEAVVAYRAYLKNHPKHSRAGWAYYGLGMCYFKMNDYASAAKELESAVGSKGPDPVLVHLFLGQALLKKTPTMPKQAEQAERAFESSLISLGLSKTGLLKRQWSKKNVTEWLGKTKESEKTQLAAEAVQGLLEVTLKQGNWNSAIKKSDMFDAIIEGSLYEQGVRILTGEAHEKSSNYKEAAVVYKAAVKLKGANTSEALFRLGMVRMNHLKAFEAAARDFGEFAEKYKSDPKRPDAAFNEALCFYQIYYAQNKEAHLNTAIGRFNKFVRSSPKHERGDIAKYYIGKLEHKRKDWNGAVKALEPLMDSNDPALEQVVYLVADSYHWLENWDKSSELYMRFAKGNEKALNADVALHNAGFAYSRLKKPDTQRAIAAYKLLEEKCPNSKSLPSAYYNLGEVYFDARRFDKARKSLREVPASHALKADADYLLAMTDLNDLKPVEAAKGFRNLSKRLIRTTPKHRLVPLSNLYQGAAEFEGKRFAESAQTLSEFVAAFSDHEKLDEAAYNLGLSQMELKKWDEAVKSFETVPEKSNLHPDALYNAAWSKRSAGKLDGAIPYYMTFLEKHANSSLANNVSLELAEVEFEIGSEKGGNPQRVEDSANRLMALLKKPALKAELRQLALWRLGVVHFNRKNYPESARTFEDLLGVGAGNFLIQAAFQAGEACRQVARGAQGDDQEQGHKAALKNFQIAVQAPKPVPGTIDAELQEQALIRVGECKWSLGLWVDSQKSYELFIESNSKHRMIRTAYLGLGMALLEQENYPDAIKSFEKTVADGTFDDTGARAQFLLGECFLEQEQYTQAIIAFRTVEKNYKFTQWQSMAAYELAQALLKKENPDGARKQLVRLIKLYPDTKAATAAKSELKLLN